MARLICLQETNGGNQWRRGGESMGNRFVEWVILEAEGTAGLLLMWDTWATEILDCVKG